MTNEIEIVDFFDTKPIETETEKDFIVKNKKKYYKTDTPYVYRCENGYYAYRISHKPSRTDTFVNKHIETKEKFLSESSAKRALQEHIFNLERTSTYKNRKVAFGEMWEDINSGIGNIYDDMIMTDTHGRYNAASSFQYYAKIIRKDICPNDKKHEDFSFYTFRKTAISIMASHSIPIGALMKITGHKKNDTLFKYYYNDENHFAQIKVAEAVKSLDTLIKVSRD